MSDGLPRLLQPEPEEGWAAWLDVIYQRLFAAFGPRYWWPSASAPPPATAEPFEMIAGAILVQNVAWQNAEKALLALQRAGLLDLHALHQAAAEAVEPLIRPAGYYRQKTTRLKGFAAHVVERYQGDLFAMLNQPLPSLREELLSLSGIGPETADCILCYAAGKPVMAMDAYTRRIFARIGLFDSTVTYDEMQAFFHRHLAADVALRGEYHALVDTLGNRVCRNRAPRCSGCPLLPICGRVGVEGAGEPEATDGPAAKS